MSKSENLFDESMRLGNSAAWEQDWDRAIGFYRKALAEHPDHPNALTNLGLALLETGKYKEALAIYHKASKITTEDPIPIEKCAEIFERLGQIGEAVSMRQSAAQIYLKRKDAQKAIVNWTHIARLRPDFLAARSRLALTYERMGRAREAVHEYLAVAAILQSEGKMDRATEAVQRAVRIAPGDPDATGAMRTLQKGQKLPVPAQPRGATAPLRMEKVRAFLRSDKDEVPDTEAELSDPEEAAQRQALTILAGLMFDEPKDDDEEEGRSLSVSALARGRVGDQQAHVGQSQIFRYLGHAIDLQTHENFDQAVKEYEKAIAAGLDHPAVHYNLGLLLKDLNDHNRARKHLMNSLGHGEFDLGANLALGRLAKEKNNLPEARHYLFQALKHADVLTVDESQSSELKRIYDGALAAQEDGDHEDLSEVVDQILKFFTDDWLKKIKGARLDIEETQRPEGPVKPIIDILAPGAERAIQSMTRIDDLISKKLYTAAMEETMMALETAPTFLDLHMQMSKILFATGQTKAGLDKLNIIAETHRVMNEIPQAIDVYRKILEESPIHISSRIRLIDLLAQQERNDEALEEYLELAEIYRQMAEIDAARKALTNALRLAQDTSIGLGWSLKILRQMGDIDLSRLDWRRGLRVYEQIRSIDPKDEKARRHVIDLNLRLGQEEQAGKELDSFLEFLVDSSRSTEALNLLEDLAREHPGKQVLHARLAEAYRAAGRTADAIAQYDALGEIQLDSGMTQEAIRTIETIVDLDPPDIEGYQELLRNLKGG